MGFYGNIQNSNKTAFTFDLVYSSRNLMDEMVQKDGVFLGRYVLVDYDETFVEAYYSPEKKWFYNDRDFTEYSKITQPKTNILYKVINVDYDTDQDKPVFYYFNGELFEPVVITTTTQDGQEVIISTSPYAVSHTMDVRRYGRGYDSTVWQKTYDNVAQVYKYVMIAELNAKVPNFRLIVDHPTETPVSPFFDRDSTTMDYYLHQSPSFGNRIKAVPVGEENRSDEEMVRNDITYTYTDEKNPTWSEEPVKHNADIYYNKAGFDKDLRTYIPNEDSRSKNTINYDRVESGKHYGYQDGPSYKAGETYPDTYEWYFRLPVLGNTISSLWDAMYGYSGDPNETGGIANNKRYLEFAQEENDKNSRRVSYNKNTLIGLMNNVRDLMGYQFLPLSVLNNGTTLETGKETVSVTHNYATSGAKATVTYNKVDVLYYALDANNSVDKYYYFAYEPSFTPVDETKMKDDGTQYYYYDGATKEYKLANIALYNATDANGAVIKIIGEDGKPITGYPYDNYFTKVDRWTLTELPVTEDSLHGLVLTLHKIIGTGDIDTRDEDTLYGAINIIKDIVANIDKELAPGRFVVTNTETGVIETSNTYFPSADWDKDELLAGDGSWVSRFASVKVRENSTNANRKIPKVVEFQTTGTATGNAPATLKNLQAELVSDNQRTNNGTKLVYNQKHDPNTLILATRDKWIKLHPDASDDSIEFEHTQSPLVNRLSYQDDNTTNDVAITGPSGDANSTVNHENFKANANGTEITIVPDHDTTIVYDKDLADQNDNRLTIPYITVDNAGHVVAAGTKNYNIPHGFKKVQTTTIADTNESASLDQAGISIAESITDTLNIAPRNRWIDIATENNNGEEGAEGDKITFSHRLVPTDPEDNTKIPTLSTAVTLNGERRTKSSDIPTVYRYGLPQNKSVANLDEAYNGGSGTANEAANTFNVPYIEVDKAGHVVAAETHTITLPENYTTIKIGAASTSVGTGTTTGAAGATSDTLATAADLSANTLTETLNFNASNKWIRLAGVNTKGNDTITIGHEIHNIITTKPTEDMDTTKNDTFSTQILTWDNAGHIVTNETKTWTLPDSIHDLKVTGTSTAVTNPAGTNGTIVADTTFDVVELNASNKWMRLTADPTKDIVTFGHLVQNIETGKRTTDLNNSGTFDTEEYTYDEAGHIRSKYVRTLTLPYGYKTIRVGNNNTDSTMMVRPNGTSIIATNQVDSYSLNGGNKWIDVAAGTSENGSYIQISHATVKDGASYTGTDTNFATFGGAVTLYGYKTDNAGHIIENPTYTLTLPKGSYSESGGDAGANVLTSLSFTDTSGALVGTKVNVGTLKITGYSTTDMTAKAISANNTLNEALALLQLEINAETTRATNAESTLQTNLNTETSTRSSEDGKLQTAIKTETTNRINADNALQDAIDAVDDRVDNVYTKTEVDNAIGALYTKAQVDQAIKDAISAFATANGLTVPTT